MTARALAAVVAVAALTSTASAGLFTGLYDDVDDTFLVDAVSGQEPVTKFAKAINAFQKTLWTYKEKEIEKLLGKPAQRAKKAYAMPVAQPRAFWMSGLRYADSKLNKDHVAFYPIEDFAGIEVWYGIDGETPRIALLYFKVDKSFPKLKKVEGKAAGEPAKKGAVTRKHTIDVDHWNKLKAGMNKQQIAQLFSAPAGDYAPGTDYVTRSWGWCRGSDAKVYETLGWRSEKGRVVVAFDEKENFVTSEFYFPGRDPVTNIAERLRWDRTKFNRVKKYVEERLAAK
jgi:hypothetical protein